MHRFLTGAAVRAALLGVATAVGLTACGTGAVGATAPPASAPPTTDRPAPTTSPGRAISPPSPGPTTAAGSVPGSAAHLVIEPNAGLAAIYDLMRGARRTVDMTMYELVDPTAESILAADAARGVAVRVVLDGRLERRSNQAAAAYLAAHGVHVVWASSGFSATHQKTITVDGRESAIMTLNLTSRYYTTTRDFAVLDTNPADVAAIESVFAGDDAGRPVSSTALPDGADLVWSPGSESRLVGLINAAGRQVSFESEELDDQAVVHALAAAARRGVTVDVVMTDDPSWHPAFAAITAAGGHVRVDHGEHPIYIHAKAIVVDGITAFVGSQNATPTSLDHNRELGVIVNVPSIVGPVGRTLAADFAAAAPYP